MYAGGRGSSSVSHSAGRQQHVPEIDDEEVNRQASATGTYKVPDRDFYRKNLNTFASIYSHFQDRLYVRRFDDRRLMQPHFCSLALQRAPYSMVYTDSPADGVCCHFLRRGFTKPNKTQFNSAVWSADCRWLVLGTQTGDLALWEGEALKVHKVISIPAHKEFFGDGTDRVKEQIPITAMAWKRHGGILVTGDARGLIQYCDDTFRNVMVTKEAHTAGAAVRGLSFSPLDSRLASCSDDGRIHLWAGDRDVPEQVFLGHQSDVKCVDWHPYRALVASGSRDCTVKLWDPKQAECVCTIQGHKKQVNCSMWNRNGNWIATGSVDGLVKVFDIRSTMRELQSFKGHLSEVCKLGWHPVHESVLLSGGYNGSLIYWCVDGLVRQGVPHSSIADAHRQSIDVIAWHPNGHLVATASHDCILKFWCREPPGGKLQLTGTEATQEAPPAYAHGPIMPGSDISPVLPASTTRYPYPSVQSGPAGGSGGGGGHGGGPGAGGGSGGGPRHFAGGSSRFSRSAGASHTHSGSYASGHANSYSAPDRGFSSRKRFRDSY